MKKLLIISLSLLIFSCNQAVNYNEEEQYFSEKTENDYYIYYYKGVPFTGAVEGVYTDKLVDAYRKNIRSRNRLSSLLSINNYSIPPVGGQFKKTFKEGKLDGPYREYFVNGQLYRKTSNKEGQIHGPYEE